MIFGIGTDVLKTDRIERTWQQFGDRFVKRLLLPAELAEFRRQKQPVRFLAMRFAGKEAVVKAMGTGFRHGMWIRDVGVVQDERGKPEIIFSERGKRMCASLGIGAGYISLTDDGGFVIAVALLLKADAGKEIKSKE